MPEGRWIVKRCRSKNRAQLTRTKSEHIYPRLAAYTKKLLGLKFTPDEVQIFPVSIANPNPRHTPRVFPAFEAP